MSEYQQQEKHSVGLNEFIAAMKFSVSADELCESVRGSNVRSRFILRLLVMDGSKAFDRFVEVVATDNVASAESRESLLVSVRPVTPDGQTGRVEPPYPVDSGGIIQDKVEPHFDRGYFVNMPGMNADEFYHTEALVKNDLPEAPPPLKYFLATPPSEEEQHRYYG